MFPSFLNSMTKGLVVMSIVCAAVLVFHSTPADAQLRFQGIAPKPLRAIREPSRTHPTTEPATVNRRIPVMTPRGPVLRSGFTIGRETPKATLTTSLYVLEIPKPIHKWSFFKKVTDSGDLNLRFSWRTGWTSATVAQLEVSRYNFVPGPVYQPPTNPDLIKNIYTIPEIGKAALLDIDFTPIVQDAIGTTVPPENPVIFYVRLIVKNSQGKILGAPSKTVRVEYQRAPGSNMQFSSMMVRYTAVRCIEETNEVGSDEVSVHFFVADLTPYNPVSRKFHIQSTDMDKGETEAFSTMVYDHPGPNEYNPNALTIVIGLIEDDDGFSSGLDLLAALHRLAKTERLSMGTRRSQLVSGFDAYLDYIADEAGGERIGGVQRLDIPMEAWTKIINGQPVAPKKLTFEGDGGRYELTFSIGQ